MDIKIIKQVILKPLISEKTLNAYKVNKVCTFWVDSKSTKKDISYSFKEVYGIEPKSITTVVQRKDKTTRNKKTYDAKTTRKYVKKAYINIGENKLDTFENIK
jgi:ribosomal protein L23